jgi:guanylate kinase
MTDTVPQRAGLPCQASAKGNPMFGLSSHTCYNYYMQDDIIQLLQNYHPSQKTVETLRSQKLIIFAGTAGAGKNSIMNGMLKTGHYHDIVTSTTREPRENNGVLERDGIDYHFLSTEQAVAKLRAGEYIEAALVHKYIYGVLASEIERAAEAGKMPIVDVDVQGVHTFKSLSDNIIAVFVVPPSYEVWMQRIKSRYENEAEFNEAWPARRESAIRELEDALSRPYYHFLINEDLDQAVHSAEGIAQHDDKFSQIDKSYRVWVERILHDLKSHS